ncbi:DUF805 domain-containing protein [Plantibacter sp. lyk4-40-MEA-4]|uniref:DUF805 domain-containing protein n=1 Tax=Plantibacter sp. lyk4-40-MEA-4 TaxID=3040298 RepID=UPI00254AF2EA|nr:DUF805 domain-containing protein [Plantibacter sp. lyk4-40-MEA-4]
MTYPPNPQVPSGQPPYGQPPYGQAPYGQAPYGQPQWVAPPPRGASSPDDLTLPLYGATFRQATKRFFKQYANFSGRASLSEYWWSSLLTTLLMLVPTLLITVGAIMTAVSAAAAAAEERDLSGSGYDFADPGPMGFGVRVLLIAGVVLLLVAWVALIVPSLAIAWRRLHDAGFPGPYYFLTLVPSVGSIIVLVLMLLPSKPEGQRFDRPAQVPSAR